MAKDYRRVTRKARRDKKAKVIHASSFAKEEGLCLDLAKAEKDALRKMAAGMKPQIALRTSGDFTYVCLCCYSIYILLHLFILTCQV